jgi:hypothetical protein
MIIWAAGGAAATSPGSVGSGVSESKAIGQCQAETRGISVVCVINHPTEVKVTLPCLNEAEGLVWVLVSMPALPQANRPGIRPGCSTAYPCRPAAPARRN